MDDLERPRRRPLLRLLGSLAVTAVLLLAVPTWILGPYFLDDRRLDAIVRVVALDWRDFGEERARARLEAELDERGVGSQVRDESCTFTTEEGDRVVHCGWTVSVEVPFATRTFPLSFTSTARITDGGDLR
jgi:hypothetical protein